MEIVFGTNDLKLTKELSERMGDDTINVTTKNRPRFWAWLNWSKQSEAEHPHRRPLMLAQEVSRLDPSEQIILPHCSGIRSRYRFHQPWPRSLHLQADRRSARGNHRGAVICQ